MTGPRERQGKGLKNMKDDQKKLKRSLTAAYYEKEKAQVNDFWQTRVMDHIRGLGPVNNRTTYLELLEHFVWRFAPVACGLIVVLAAALMQIDVVSDYEIAKAFVDPLDFSLFQVLQTS